MANFPTFNPLHPGTTSQLSEGNTVFKHIDNADGTTGKTNGFCFPPTGKYYIEITQLNALNSQIYGLNSDGGNLAYYSSPEYSAGNATSGFDFDYRSANSNMPSVSIGSPAAGDIIQILVDCDNGRFKFGRNDTFEMFGRTPPSDTKYGTDDNLTWFPMDPTGETRGSISLNGKYSLKIEENLHIAVNDGGSGSLLQCRINFGQLPFRYTPPSGFVALSTENLAEPPISNLAAQKPEDYFNVVTWTGDGSNENVTGVGFQPDLVWGKSRSNGIGHMIYDSVRGAGKMLASNATGAEITNSPYGYLSSFDSDGHTWTVGSSDGSYGTYPSATYVAWCWKAGGTAVENTDGSITSQVSVNTESGFSIVSYTGTGSAATVGHGLNTAPSLIIVKPRSETANWVIYHSSVGATKYLLLNTTAAEDTASTVWNNTAPTSSVFSLGTNTNVNGNTTQEIAYCWAEVEGYSSIGSYVGNGSSDGTFVYTGFRPAFVMLKPTTNGDNWIIQDGIREPYNPSSKRLFPNLSNAEVDNPSAYSIDFLSNGFKPVVSHSSTNQSGEVYIYMAFAESPFKYSSAR